MANQYGNCATCGGSYQLTTRGKMRPHNGSGNLPCPGSGKTPK